MTSIYFVTQNTPDGAFTAVLNREAILASGWTADPTYFLPLIHASIRPTATDLTDLTPLLTSHQTQDGYGAGESSEIGVAHKALQALEAFYDADPQLLRHVPVHQKSGPYRELAWQVLREVEAGQPITYAQYAQRTGNPAAVRAAASACAKNAAALFVPCHRILRTDGTLGGFRYGLDIKESLLRRESHA